MGTSNYYVIGRRDAYALKSDVTYATARAAASSDSMNYDGYSNIAVGQNTGFDIYRGYVYIDTREIGSTSTITDASLWVYVNSVSGSGFKIQLQDGQPTYPTEAVPVVGDYDMTNYSGNMGESVDVGSMSVPGWVEIPLSADGRAAINKTGITKFCVRSDLDIAGTQPSGAEYLLFRACDYNVDEKGQYYLTVTHNGPTQVTYEVGSANANSYITETGTSGWAAHHDAASGDSVTTSDSTIGCLGSGTTRTIHRQVFAWDTSGLPDNAIIESAKVKLWLVQPPTTTHTIRVQTHSDPASPLAVDDYAMAKWSGDYSQLVIDTTDDPDRGWRYWDLDADGIALVDRTGTTYFGMRDEDYDVDDVDPVAGIYYSLFNAYDDGVLMPKLVITYTEPLTDTAVLLEPVYRLFAHRTVSNADIYDNPKAASISYLRLYDSNEDYLQLRTARNYNDSANPLFDMTGGSEADPEYTTVTQYYRDLDLAFEVPRFNKVFDVSENTWIWATDPFAVVNYELFNEAGVAIAEAADSTTNMSFDEGQRYLVRFKIRIFNDMVEQNVDDNTRCVIMEEGLQTIARRALLNGSTQESCKPPMFMGVGSEGGYHIDSGVDIRWDVTAPDGYNVVTDGNPLFPAASAEGDSFAYLREDATDDDVEGISFALSTKGVPADATSLIWEYYDTNGAWVALNGVEDNTDMFRYNGTVTWEVPMDIDPLGQAYLTNTGRWFRCRIVGGGFTTEPIATDISEDVTAMSLRTQHNETDLQFPLNRKIADLVITPAIGHSAKVSAAFGPGGLAERTRADGTLLSRTYEPIKEVGLFTTIGVTDNEDVELGEYTGAVASGQIDIPTATNPAPIKLYNAITDTGELYNVSDRFVTYNETGGNYETVVPLPDDTFDLTYLGKNITPSVTPQNILSVSGNVQNLVGPNVVWTYAATETPVDSDSGYDTKLTPRRIMMEGLPMYGNAHGEGSLSPVFSKGPGDRGLVVAATDFGLASNTGHKIKRTFWGKGLAASLSGGLFGAIPDILGPFDKIEYTFTAGYPMVMLNFNVSDYDRLIDPILVVNGTGKTKNPVAESESKFYFDVMVWTEGDPMSLEPHQRETGWKLLQSSTPVPGQSKTPETVVVQIPMRYSEEGEYVTSPYVDERGNMFILVVSNDKNTDDGKWTHETTLWREMGWDNFLRVGKTISGRMSKRAKRMFGNLGIAYVGLIYNPVGPASSNDFGFRRGVDWTYYPGDAEALWRIDGSSGTAPEDYTVNTSSGDAYIPVLPTARIGQKEEHFYFGTHPDATDWPTDTGKTGNLYLQHQPVPGGVSVRLEGEEKRYDTTSKKITINSVGWEADYLWNNVNPDYSWDHLEKASDGEGAGYVNVTFNNIKWSATKFRDVYVRYLYYEQPKMTMTYLHGGGKLFARAHFSDVSHNTAMRPAYGDRVRFYFEIQFEPKRTA